MWDEDDQAYRHEEMDQDYRTILDRAIEVGWKFYQDAICPKCGIPWWYGRATDSRVQFQVDESVCYSCAELEMSTEKKMKTSGKRHGVTDTVEPVGVYYEQSGESEPLPSPFELLR